MAAKIINLFGGPGTGKSTTAAGLFYLMKKGGYKVELVTEYAKDLVYQKSFHKMKDQGYLFSKQHHRIWQSKDDVDYIITDAPLINNVVYVSQNDPIYSTKVLKKYIVDIFNHYDNINFFLQRDESTYQTYGRTQDLDGAKQIDKQLLEMFKEFNISFHSIDIDNSSNIIFDFLQKRQH